MPLFGPRRERWVRALDQLADARACLSQALEELAARHPDDPDLAVRIAGWSRAGGVPFRP